MSRCPAACRRAEAKRRASLENRKDTKCHQDDKCVLISCIVHSVQFGKRFMPSHPSKCFFHEEVFLIIFKERLEIKVRLRNNYIILILVSKKIYLLLTSTFVCISMYQLLFLAKK